MCVWEGDMTAILDLMKFSAILCNAHKWALHEQRPRISGFLDLWKAQYPMGTGSCSTEKQEATGTLPESKTMTTPGAGSLEPSSLGHMEPRERDRLLNVLRVYQEILNDERRERQRLMARVDEMQKRLQDVIGHRDSSDPASPASRLVQPIGSQQSPRNQNSTMAKPIPISHSPQPHGESTTALDPFSTQNRTILPLRRRPLAISKQKIKAPQTPSVRPEIFGKGILVSWTTHPGRAIRVRLPKSAPITLKSTTDRTPIFKFPTPALTQTPDPDTELCVFGGQLAALATPATPSKPTGPAKPSGTVIVQDEKGEAALQTRPTTSIFSSLKSVSEGAGLFQAGSSTTSIFSTPGLNPAVPPDLPGFKFHFTGTPTKAPSKAEQIRPTSQDLPEFSFASPLPEVDQTPPVPEHPSKFNFATPLPKVKQPAFHFSFAPLPTSKDKPPGFDSVLSPSPPPEKDRTPAPTPILFFSPPPATATATNTKTSRSTPAPFPTPPNPKTKTPPTPHPTTAQHGSPRARNSSSSSTPLWHSPFSSSEEGEKNKPSKPGTQTPPSTQPTATNSRDQPKAEPTKHASEQATPTHDTPNQSPAATNTTREPLLATLPSTSEAEGKGRKMLERVWQAGEGDEYNDDDDERYDAGDEEDEELEDEGEVGGCDVTG